MTKNTNLKRQIREHMAVTGENYLTATRNIMRWNRFYGTPWSELNSAFTGGYRAGLHVIGGRPGSGKTAFSLQLANHDQQGRVLYFTPDMTVPEIRKRAAQVNQGSVSGAVQFINSLNWTSREIQEEAYRWSLPSDRPLTAIILGGDGVAAVADDEAALLEADVFTGELLALSHELNIPVFLLAPLRREGGSGSPVLTDLFESVRTAAADTVLLLERNPDDNSATAHVSKNRYGTPGGMFQVRWGTQQVFETPSASWNTALHGGFTAGVNVIAAADDNQLQILVQRLGVELHGLEEELGDEVFGVVANSMNDFSAVHALHSQASEKDIPVLCFVAGEVGYEFASSPVFASASQLLRNSVSSGANRSAELSIMKVVKDWKISQFPMTL